MIAGGVVLLAAGGLVLLLTAWAVWSAAHTDDASRIDRADAIVVLGAAQYDGTPSPQLRARLDHALELYQAGDAPFVVVTGGNQPGDRFTEAEASARYLIERGVPEEAILQETEGGSTWESMAGVSEVLAPLGLERVLLVSDPFHLLRSRLIAEEVGLEAYTSPSSGGPVRGGENVVKHLKEAAGISVGRVIGFERLWGITG